MPIPAVNTILFGNQRGLRKIQFKTSPNASAGVATATLNGVRVGSQIVVGIVVYDATATVSSIACTGESNLTARGSLFRAGAGVLSDASIQFYTLDSTTTGGDKIITMTLSGSVSGVFGVWEFIGGDSTAFFEGQATAAANTVNITTASDKAMVCAIGISAGSQSANSPYTREVLTQPLQNNSIYYNLNSGSAGTKVANFNGTGNQLILAASFKAAP
jgi:hypothetical protein